MANIPHDLWATPSVFKDWASPTTLRKQLLEMYESKDSHTKGRTLGMAASFGRAPTQQKSASSEKSCSYRFHPSVALGEGPVLGHTIDECLERKACEADHKRIQRQEERIAKLKREQKGKKGKPKASARWVKKEVAAAVKAAKTPSVTCPMCDGNHTLATCPVVAKRELEAQMRLQEEEAKLKLQATYQPVGAAAAEVFDQPPDAPAPRQQRGFFAGTSKLGFNLLLPLPALFPIAGGAVAAAAPQVPDSALAAALYGHHHAMAASRAILADRLFCLQYLGVVNTVYDFCRKHPFTFTPFRARAVYRCLRLPFTAVVNGGKQRGVNSLFTRLRLLFTNIKLK